jgi:YidC/Oxa1 family membrane protein insertase
MKLSALTLALVASPCATVAFAPSSGIARPHSSSTMTTARSMAVDPTAFADMSHQVSALQDAVSSLLVSDAGLIDAADNVAGATDAAAAAGTDNGWFGFLAGPIEFLLQVIHKVLVGVGMPANAWGISIVAMTLVIKVLTYPLTKSQLESTSKMQVSLFWCQDVLFMVMARHYRVCTGMNLLCRL